jgi:hypothetical protein
MVMQSMNKKVEKVRRARLTATIGIGVVLLMSGVRLSLAQQASQETFPSAEKASKALFAAVQSENEVAITQIVGGRKELVASGDPHTDQQERELFSQKYQEMHRLGEEPDGTTTLYIGAENWPFPVPLASKNGKWFFDAHAGSQEVLFRRVGENEATAAEICRRLAAATNNRPERQANTDNADVQYALTLVDAGAIASSERPRQQSTPLHGYYFEKLENDKAGAGSFTIVAYPAEYRSSGVMTFAVTPSGIVYEKDLGLQTPTLANAMTTRKPDRTWHLVKETEYGD